MNRRGFLGFLGKALAVGAVAAAVPDAVVSALAPDPDQLAWVPGAKTHILPPAGGWGGIDFAKLDRQYRTGQMSLQDGFDYWYKPHPKQLAFHRDAFSFVSQDLQPPDTQEFRDAIAQAAKRLADDIDAQGLKLYAEMHPHGVSGMQEALTEEKLRKDIGVSMRMVNGYDERSDKHVARFDVLYGWATLNPQLALRIKG